MIFSSAIAAVSDNRDVPFIYLNVLRDQILSIPLCCSLLWLSLTCHPFFFKSVLLLFLFAALVLRKPFYIVTGVLVTCGPGKGGLTLERAGKLNKPAICKGAHNWLGVGAKPRKSLSCFFLDRTTMHLLLMEPSTILCQTPDHRPAHDIPGLEP